MTYTSIEWTQCTWNPLTGCTRVSAGCANCYAERMTRRLRAMELARGVSNGKYAHGFELRTHPEELARPAGWRKPQMIFVNSMSDLFHERAPFAFIKRVFATMLAADWHVYQILTKRSKLLAKYDAKLRWAAHIWMGVTVEHADYLYRLDHLRSTHASVKFLSLEPLLGSLPDLDLTGIDWVIAGGESGPGARPVNPEWIRDIRDQCLAAGVPFFFKQWGGVHKKKLGRTLDGHLWDGMPEAYYRSARQPAA